MSYNIIYETEESTVVTKFKDVRTYKKSYQSEKELELDFIENLQKLGYEYIHIKNEEELISNLRKQIENLNNYQFEDEEWEIFLKEKLEVAGVLKKAKLIHTDEAITDTENSAGSQKNIILIDKKNIHNNKLQVINQYREDGGRYRAVYDVTILINGLPLIHIELKRKNIPLKEAFNQIERYKRESFSAGSSLFEFIQIYIISNGLETKYYSNTIREDHITNRSKNSSNTFEFTMYWADSENKKILDLINFTNYFFARHTILNIISKYCVLNTQNQLLVMRPYQIVACEKILNKIKYAENNNLYGKIEAGGYIWHTTGSGKTLTSFKTSILATKTGYIDKVFFVVDRKDLDSQTIKEYNNFQEGCVSSNKSTKVLQEQIERDDPIIVTTIQKLSNFVKSNKSHHIFNKKVVIIFDECHRSQFGDMHSNITKNFKKYCLFGFTGTPIFEKNAPKLKGKTTLQLFGDKLHTYTIVDAINDGTVLPFKIEYFDTVKAKDNIEDKKVHNINTEEVLLNETRIKGIVKHIIDSFNDKTKDKRFNSILAVSSIPAAIKYYKAFQEILKAKETDLKVATIFTYNPNEEDEGYIDDESFDTDGLDTSSRDFLEGAIKDYNNMFQTSFDTSGKNFENYYEDISRRLKKKELDLLIVVNMFLTGFDAKTLNTLWVDKNLKYHSLIQAFSRTNRILNSVKTFGNIICYRNLKENLQAAIGLFGDKNAESIIVLRDYKSYLNGYEEDGEYKKGYLDYVDELYNKFPLDEEIISEERQKEFIALYNTLLKFRNILTTFEEFKKDDPFNKEDKQVDLDDYQAKYINIYTKTRKREDKQKESILGDVVFEIELIEDVEVNVDYILKMVIEYKLAGKNDNARLSIIINKIKSSLKLYDKVELIEEFISKINIASVEEGYSAWKSFTTENKEKELMKIIKEENLKEKETIDYMKNAFNDGVFRTNGVDFDGLLPNISRFSKENNRMEKTNMVTQKLTDFFNKYYNIM